MLHPERMYSIVQFKAQKRFIDIWISSTSFRKLSRRNKIFLQTTAGSFQQRSENCNPRQATRKVDRHNSGPYFRGKGGVKDKFRKVAREDLDPLGAPERDQRQESKIFVVILPRRWNMNRTGKFVRPVLCAEIDHVIPEVTSGYFHPMKPPPGLTKRQQKWYRAHQLRSIVKLKGETTHWFSLEKKWEAIVYGEIMVQVFIERHTQADFDRIDAMLCGSLSENGVSNSDCT